jgi:hypothetical protein
MLCRIGDIIHDVEVLEHSCGVRILWFFLWDRTENVTRRNERGWIDSVLYVLQDIECDGGPSGQGL